MHGFRKNIGKKIAALALILALMATGLIFPGQRALAQDSGVRYVRVLLSTQDAGSLSIPVTGSYTLLESGRSFSGGTLTVTASGSTITVRHSAEGQLYSGTSATVERASLSRTAGHLRLRVVSGTRNFLGHFTFSARDGAVRVVNRVPLSHYLYGVVGYEMSNEFPLEALKAQAVAAKGYVLLHLSNSGSYDIGDTASDQVYRGYVSSYTNVINAVDSTINDVLYYNGAPLLCYYAASNGGWMLLPGTRWSDKSADGAYASGQDIYDMENPSTPRETVYIPKTYSQREMGTRAFAFVDVRMTNAIAQPGVIPEGFYFGGVRSIDSVTSSGDAGNAQDLNHTNITVNATILANLEEHLIPTPTPEWPANPTPTPEITPNPTATPPFAQAQVEPATAETESAMGLAAENPAGLAAESGQTVVAPAAPEDGVVPPAAPSSPVETEPPAPAQDLITPSPTPEWPELPTPTPEWDPTPSPTPTPELTREIPISFSFTFQEMVAAGLFTSNDLRIYYARQVSDGFELLHARYGHGVGMSQRGAQQMANMGKSYREILNYYYPGAQMGTMGYVSPETVASTGGQGSASSSGQGSTVSTSASTGTVTGGTVNLRRAATTGSDSLEKLEVGTNLTLLGMEGEWYYVSAPSGNTGFVRHDYVFITGTGLIAAGVVNASAVNYRTGPDTSFETIGRLSHDTQVGVYGMESGWYKVLPSTTGIAGFVLADYITLTTTRAEAGQPQATPVPAVTQQLPALPEGATPQPIVIGGATSAPVDNPPAADTPIPAPGPNIAPVPIYAASGYINATKVNIRQGASTTTTSFGRLNKNTQLGVYEKTGSWYRVRVLGTAQDGYVYGKYVTLHNTLAEEGSQNSTANSPAGSLVTTVRRGYVNASGVRVRSGPGTGYDSLGKLSRNTTLNILGSSGSWVHVEVRASGVTGYIFNKYVTITGTVKQETVAGVITARLNLRTAPTTSSGSQVLLVMPKGAVVTVHNTVNGWCYITYNGTQGYCISSCVRMDG